MPTITVNGVVHTVNASTDTPLLWVLRDILGLTGTKYGCGMEICGACTIIADGQTERSCNFSLGDAIGKSITTIEGLSPTGTHPVQVAWVAEQVPQCGYCQSGMLMSAACLLAKNPKPTDADINSDVPNLCVCGTYPRVRKAIHRAAGN